jgi:hypothetical protein
VHNLIQKFKRYPLIAAVLMLLIVAACGNDDEDSDRSERKTQGTSYSALVAAEPAHGMTYSPTRRTINRWVDTWNVKGQLAFTYILNNAGEKVGYYVFDGPPVSMCASLTPTYKFVDIPEDGSDSKAQVNAPSLDGVFYSGGQCLSYYGIDASTGSYLEFSIGGALNYLLSSQPLAIDAEVKPLGPTDQANADCTNAPPKGDPFCTVPEIR